MNMKMDYNSQGWGKEGLNDISDLNMIYASLPILYLSFSSCFSLAFPPLISLFFMQLLFHPSIYTVKDTNTYNLLRDETDHLVWRRVVNGDPPQGGAGRWGCLLSIARMASLTLTTASGTVSMPKHYLISISH